ncbi:FAD-dependent oxidoreductase [Streptomyces sp. PmtG]
MAARIVVLGAGYAGVVAAKSIAKRPGTRVILVNASDRFVERVRVHQVAAGQVVRQRPIAQLLAGAPVEFVVDRVVAVDATRREVVLADGAPLAYDTLVYALGSFADRDAVPGVAEHAYTLAVADDAARLRARLAEGSSVTVVGGGLTGIEAAAELAETRPEVKVRLVCGGELGAALSERGRQHLRRVFDRLGVDVRDSARVTQVSADGVLLADGAFLPADTVVWTTGFRVPEIAREAGFAVDDQGRMVVDETLRSVSHPDVYAIGDAAAARDGRTGRSCAWPAPPGCRPPGTWPRRSATVSRAAPRARCASATSTSA